MDSLEPRRMLTVTLLNPITRVFANPTSANQTVPLSGVFRSDNISGSVVRFQTQLGNTTSRIDLELFDQQTSNRSAAPQTTDNFLRYVNSGRYTDTIFHRALNFLNDSLPSQFFQGGSFRASSTTNTLSQIQTDAPIPLEFANDRPNVRGTIAMARTNQLNSATSGFFFNTQDNSSVFTAGNPYAVFGRVISGLATLDQYSALPKIDGSFNFAGQSTPTTFQGVPVADANAGTAQSNLVILRSATVVPTPRSQFSFDVQSSDAEVVTSSIVNGGLVLDFGSKVGTSTITVTAVDLTGESRVTTFAVSVGQPVLALSLQNQAITPSQSTPLSLGNSFVGQSSTRTFTVRNSALGQLSIGDITLPAGFSVLTAPPSLIESRRSATFVLAIDTAVAGTLAGNVSITTNGALSGMFTFPISATVGSTVTLGAVGARSVTFTDADGTRATFSYRGPGSAVVGFSGTSLFSSTTGGATTVGGINAAITDISVNGSTLASGLSLSVRGGNRLISVTTLSADAVIRSIALGGAVVTDGVTLTGGAANLSLAQLDSATLAITGSAGTINLGSATQSTVTASGAIGRLTAGDLVETRVIAAALSTTATARNITDSTLTYTGGLGQLTVTNAVTRSSVTLSGPVKRVTAGQFVSSALTTGTLGAFTVTQRTADVFSGSSILAQSAGTISLGQLTSAGTLSTVRAATLTRLTGRPATGRPFSFTAISAGADIGPALTAAGVPATRLVVNGPILPA